MKCFVTYGRTYSDPNIRGVEVEKITEHFVVIKGRRTAKVSGYDSYHETWQAARECLIGLGKKEVEVLRIRLARAEEWLAKAQAIPEVSHAD